MFSGFTDIFFFFFVSVKTEIIDEISNKHNTKK